VALGSKSEKISCPGILANGAVDLVSDAAVAPVSTLEIRDCFLPGIPPLNRRSGLGKVSRWSGAEFEFTRTCLTCGPPGETLNPPKEIEFLTPDRKALMSHAKPAPLSVSLRGIVGRH